MLTVCPTAVRLHSRQYLTQSRCTMQHSIMHIITQYVIQYRITVYYRALWLQTARFSSLLFDWVDCCRSRLLAATSGTAAVWLLRVAARWSSGRCLLDRCTSLRHRYGLDSVAGTFRTPTLFITYVSKSKERRDWPIQIAWLFLSRTFFYP